jgi:hypothetical protein
MRPSNVPMATGAKRAVLLGKVTPNGPHSTQRNGTSNATEAVNGAARKASGTATHKAKAARVNKVSRHEVAAKAKAAAR